MWRFANLVNGVEESWDRSLNLEISNLLPYLFVNKILFSYIHNICGIFHAIMKELRNCDKDCMTWGWRDSTELKALNSFLFVKPL